MANSKWGDRLTVAVNLTVVVIVLWFALRADGPIGQRIADRRERARVEGAIRAAWPELIQGARVDSASAGTKLVVEFSDYQCPACQQAHFQLAEVARDAGVGIVFRHVPNVQQHPMADGAARAAICAHRQGKFREMNHRLFSSPDWHATPKWHALAREIAIPDTAQFRWCLSDPSVGAEIASDIATAQRLGYRGTPTFVGPRGMLLGIPSKERLASLIE